MKRVYSSIRSARMWFVVALVALASTMSAQTTNDQSGAWMNVYGFAQLDMGFDTKQTDPNWFDVLRTTKLPAYKNQFGKDGNFYASVRQSRFGVKTGTPTSLGELKTQFEWELFGTGVDAGQTTIRLRHAYGELGQFGGGQTWSPFMDIDVFPNSLEYWGPPGMAFFRNVQVRYMPIKGDTFMTIALERPGASADQGTYADRISVQDVKGRFPYPDVSAEYRHAMPWGYIEGAGIVRYMEWNAMNPNPAFDPSGSGTGWGINLSSNIKPTKNDTFRLSYVYGEGIENYMNDAPVDVGVEPVASNKVQNAFEGKLLPVTGIVAFLDHNWNDQWSTSVGYSSISIDNATGQAPSAFHKGQYALANALYSPVKNFMVGGEVQWGKRENYKDGFTADDLRFQFTVKATFNSMFGGKS